MSQRSQNPYGLNYFDKPEFQDDEVTEGYDEKSCPGNCCDKDCECDDCERCAENGLAGDEESYRGSAG